ncbi:hypothetical protein BP00DRAFT_343229 [Aspergillus indologenus CBS 114.80]|uniref:Thioredoxin reductase n=1 Tax=Aspergillus indologenus CBS 114.80 TaxID=1450541 RepID=A0A2V5IBW8_9EURO|nr:hypothetical protein BP00DRAFT_343229 [Aspergillus indologenus CBS 114.80]
MSAFSFAGQKLDNNLVGSIASLLNAAGVPNLLWGNYLLTVYGVPTIVDGVAFVVPDALLEKGLSTLSGAGFLPCTQGLECPCLGAPQSLSSLAHLHINDELVVSLYRKSEMLWDFPEFDIATDSADIISASDGHLPLASLARGQGRFPAYLSAVRIPTAIRYCEAVINLLCRDHKAPREPYWLAIVTYILEYVDGTEAFHEECLKDGYRQFYTAMKQGDSKMFHHLKTLRDSLVKSNM